MSAEYERMALGCFLADNDLLDDRRLSAELFQDRKHQVILETMRALRVSGAPVTLLTIADGLNGQIEKIGGASYLASLSGIPEAAANAEFYIGKLNEEARGRGIDALAKAIQEKRREGAPVDDICQEIESRELELRQQSSVVATVDNGETLHKAIERMEETAAGRRKGLHTGFQVLDRILGDLEGGELLLIGARPSVGKTALALSIAYKMFSRGIRVAFVSLEMNRDQVLGQRLLSMRAGIPIKRVKGWGASPEDMEAVMEAAGALSMAPFALIDQPKMDLPAIRAWLLGQVTGGARIGFIDYAQLIDCGNGERKRYEKMSDISAGLKALARECNIPLIVLCQLNREMEKDGGREPMLADLRDSGSFEQDADIVALLSRPKSEEDPDVSVPAMVHVAKNRGGGEGYIKLLFRRTFTEFREGET